MMQGLAGFLTAYLLMVNICGFILCKADKERARKNLWRVPEKRFFLIAVFGGGPGVLAGMYMFRHKTRHRSFTLGIPAIIVIECILAVCICRALDIF